MFFSLARGKFMQTTSANNIGNNNEKAQAGMCVCIIQYSAAHLLI
jgi:hypothetical protein